MTYNEVAKVFFTPLYQRTTYAARYSDSLSDLLSVLCPADIIYSLALGADNMSNQFNIQSYHKTHNALDFLMQEASNYSKTVAMPLWTEASNLIGAARMGKTICNIAGQILDFNFGDIIGELFGLHSKGGPKRGDHLFYNLDIATRTLIDNAKRRYFNDIEDALKYDFGR